MIELSIERYLKESRRLLPLSHESKELYKNILFNLNKSVKNFDDEISIVGIYTPEYKNTIVPLDKCYIVIDFSLMDLLIELTYIFENNDWERFRYLYYVLSQEPELESGNLDKVFFYSTLADSLFDEEKEVLIDDSKNMLNILLSFYFITYHEFFHYQEKSYPHNQNYYANLKKYIDSINFESSNTTDQIAEEVICDTEAINQLLHSGVGLDDGFVDKTKLFEICLDTLVMLTVIQLLLHRINNVNEITKRVWATFGWINKYLSENKIFQDIDYLSVIQKEENKISLFFENTLKNAHDEHNMKVQIPDLSNEEQIELLNVLLKRKDGVIIKV